MFPRENIETLNRRLKDTFGSYEGHVRYRITWPNDEFEIRRMNFTEEGFQLIHPEFRRVHKYEQWRFNHWILERIMEVPVVNQSQLAGANLSYEPVWTLEEIQIAWPPIRFICQRIEEKIGKKLYKEYKHPYEGLTTKEQLEKKQEELEAIYQCLYGNETKVGDALAYHGAIVVPTSYIGSNARKTGENTK